MGHVISTGGLQGRSGETPVLCCWCCTSSAA